jgi:hypothetical protein
VCGLLGCAKELTSPSGSSPDEVPFAYQSTVYVPDWKSSLPSERSEFLATRSRRSIRDRLDRDRDPVADHLREPAPRLVARYLRALDSNVIPIHVRQLRGRK